MASKKPLNVTDESRSVPMTIFLLAWPVFVEQIFSTLVSFADTAMVGALGKEATAAISINYGNFIQLIIDFLLMAFCVFMVLRVIVTSRAKLEAMQKKEKEEAVAAVAEEPAPISEEVLLLREIRDSLKGSKE